MIMVVDGYIGIEYALFIGIGYDDVVQLWFKIVVGYIFILVVVYGGFFGENLMY